MKKYSGFTLLEILLYVVIGGVTLVIAVFSFAQLNRLSTSFRVNNELNQTANSIIEQIQNLVNETDTIISPKPGASADDEIILRKDNIETTIKQDSNNITVSYNNGDPSYNLNPTGILVVNDPANTLSFEQIDTQDNSNKSSISQSIKLKFTLRYNKPAFSSYEYEAEKAFETTLNLANKTSSFQPILNTQPTGANGVAYGLRKLSGFNTNPNQLSSAYNGPAIKVRRDRGTDQSEMDIGFTSKGELDQVALQNFVGYQNFLNYSEDITASGTLATGGDTTTDIPVGTDTYRVHTFTTVGTSSLNVIQGGEFEYLVVGGGGGGQAMTGGGAGGYRSSVAGESSGGGGLAELPLILTPNNYTVMVGDGGAVGNPASFTEFGKNGGNSSFAGIISLGGGGGSVEYNGSGLSGGSGGGGHNAGGSGTSAQGLAGGTGSPGSGGCNGNGGGGGGAATTGSGRNGGNGIISSINGTLVTRAGGGAGEYNLDCGGAVGTAGTGGGGGSRVAGQVNTGGGGGSRAAGGSGIVIVRYKLATGGNLPTNWSLNNITTIPDNTQAPDGTNTAEKVNLSIGNNNKSIAKNTNIVSGSTYTESYYVKANNNYNSVQIAPDTGFSSTAFQNYNLSGNGSLGSSSGVSTGQANIQSVGNGWYRISLTATANSTVSGRMVLSIVSSASSARLESINTTTATDSIFVWGAMRHLGSTLKPYQKTDINANTGDGYITTWYDQSGNKNNAIQSTTSAQPKIVDGVNGIIRMNNKPVLRFDGTDDALVSSSFNNATNSTAFFVASRATNNQSFMARSTNYAILGSPDLFNTYYLNKSNAVAGAGADTKNSLNIYTTIRTSTINSTLAIGAGSTGNFLNGNMAELIIYDGNKLSNKTAVENNLRDYYGTP